MWNWQERKPQNIFLPLFDERREETRDNKGLCRQLEHKESRNMYITYHTSCLVLFTSGVSGEDCPELWLCAAKTLPPHLFRLLFYTAEFASIDPNTLDHFSDLFCTDFSDWSTHLGSPCLVP